MASSSSHSLQQAVSVMERAFLRLHTAAETAAHDRLQSAANRESMQAELTQTWQRHTAEIEARLAQSESENQFLKADNLRLSNQLQALQRDYLELQKLSDHTAVRLDSSIKQLDLILEH